MSNLNKDWEEKIYSHGRQLNKYPYDLVVSIVARYFFHLPLKERSKIKVLDLGCGAGNNAKFLAENGFQVFGIDGSASAIDICSNRFKRWRLKGKFVCQNFEKLPYKNNFFDLVIDRESSYANIPAVIRNILKEVHRTVKKGGLFVSFIYNNFYSHIKSGKLIGKNVYGDFQPDHKFYGSGVAHVVDIKELLEFYSIFKIENIMRNSLAEIYDTNATIMEYDEYVVIAKK